MNKPEETDDQSAWYRSPELISRSDSALLVVDLQEKVLAKVGEKNKIVWNADRLVRAAQLLNVNCAVSEQYPERLGQTVAPLGEKLGSATAKRMFSCRECRSMFQHWRDNKLRQIVVIGIETHVCILQTALDLLAEGFSVYVPVDAVGARGMIDHETALRRMEISGAALTTTESVLFEWCETSLAPEFKQISQLVQEQPPQ